MATSSGYGPCVSARSWFVRWHRRHAPPGFGRSGLLHNGANRPCERP